MESKWLEDFLTLAETASFSRAAALRHVTQPAFSRRIRALENWLGAELVDRSSVPTSLTPAGQAFYDQASDIVERIQQARALLQGRQRASQDHVAIAAPPALAGHFLPAWLAGLQERFGRLPARLLSLQMHEAAQALQAGECDLLLCYHHERHPVRLDGSRFEAIELGSDSLQPFTARTMDGAPRHGLAVAGMPPQPFLAYAPQTYFGRVADGLLAEAPAALERHIESDLPASLRLLTLAGHGIAFLPASLAQADVRARRLVPADAAPAPWRARLEIRLYRERPQRQRPAGPLTERLWQFLQAGQLAN